MDEQRPPKVRIQLPTWLTLVILAAVVAAILFGVAEIADNAEEARKAVESWR